MKFCNKCKTEKNIDQFVKDASKKDGLKTICKDCRNKPIKYTINTNETNYKVCSTCKIEKLCSPLYFHKANDRKYGFSNICKECKNIKKYSKTKIINNFQICDKCGLEKEHNLNNFYPKKKCKHKLDTTCKLCTNNIESNKTLKPEYYICKCCGVEKKFNNDNFFVKNNRKYGLSTICKICIKPNKGNKINSNLYICNSCGIEKEHNRDNFIVNNNNKLLRTCKECFDTKFINMSDDEFKKHIVRGYHKKYRLKHKDNVLYKIKITIRRLINNVLSYKNEIYINKDLGYTRIQLIEHLEKQFNENMSWDNYGTWHVDHIIPITKFDKTTPIYVINHLENLQPLDGIENMSKNNHIELLPERTIGEHVLFLNENKKYQLK
jgi:hypothetical protein